MNLHFERRNGYFISEFEVTNDFNLHIEKDPTGQFLVYQRTAGGAYDLVADFGKNKGDDPIIDYDFSALVYPKYIQIKSSVNPAIATITTDGEVNELIYQEKSINITSNGAVAISADAGYNGLASVNVKVNVPQSGEGGGESGSTMEYLDVSGQSNIGKHIISIYATFVKGYADGVNGYATGVPLYSFGLMSSNMFDSISAIAIDFSYVVKWKQGDSITSMTIGESLIKSGITQADIDAVPRITKEEFYTL